MFVAERQTMIINLLHSNGKVLVKELAQRFEVSEDCIRKDLATLEGRGLLKRAYGGAVFDRINLHKEDVVQRKNLDVETKNHIAKIAYSLIRDGDMVFLDISTTNIALASLILQGTKKITVVSNMVEVMKVLSVPCEITFIFIGGQFNRGRDGFIGSMAIDSMQNLQFDISFMGVVGVNVFEKAIYTYVVEDGLTKKTILANSKYAYMLCESAKFKMEGNYKYAQLDDFTGIILEEQLSQEFHDSLQDVQIDVLY